VQAGESNRFGAKQSTEAAGAIGMALLECRPAIGLLSAFLKMWSDTHQICR
jgi:hypothetical protein